MSENYMEVEEPSYKSFAEAFFTVTYGYKEPDLIAMNKITFARFREWCEGESRKQRLAFRNAETIVDENLPDGMLHFYNSGSVRYLGFHLFLTVKSWATTGFESFNETMTRVMERKLD